MKINKFNISQTELDEICKRFLIKELSLFGSINSDNFNEDSDIDLLVAFEDHANFSLFDIVRIKDSFENLFNRRVDLVSKNAIKQSRNIYRRDAILKSAKVIYVS
jgi:uncharacterized protein